MGKNTVAPLEGETAEQTAARGAAQGAEAPPGTSKEEDGPPRGCCCCKSSKVEPLGVFKAEAEFWTNKGKCHDSCCIPIFVAFWAGMVLVFILAATNRTAPLESLVYGKDYAGYTCGAVNEAVSDPARPYKDLTSKKYLMYPLSAQTITTDPTALSLYGICTEKCPSTVSKKLPEPYICDCMSAEKDAATTLLGKCNGFDSGAYNYNTDNHDCHCEHDGRKCWSTTYPTKATLFRCIPCENPDSDDCTVAANYTTICQDRNGNVLSSHEGANYQCGSGQYKYLQTLSTSQVVPDNQIGDVVSGFYATVTGHLADLYLTSYVIFGCGAGVSMVAAWLWVFLMQWFVKPLTFFTIVGVLALEAAVAGVGLVKANTFGNVTVLGYHTGDYAVEESEQWLWGLLGWVLAVLFVVCTVFICMKINKIRQATQVIAETSHALRDMPFMVLFPVLPLVVSLLFFGYWVVGAALIHTCDTITVNDLTATIYEMTELVNGTEVTVNGTAGTNAYDSDSSIVAYMFWYHLFGWLWMNQLIAAISMTSISAAYTYWYFNYTRREDERSKIMWNFLRALKRVCRYHLGSMIFGAGVVAAVQFVRILLAYIDRQTRPWQDKNKLFKILFKVVHVCMWCFEKAVKFITRNAYIMIAMRGKGFCRSAWEAFKNILSNVFLIGVTNLISVVLILMGKLCCVFGCMAVCFLWLSAGSFTTDEAEYEADTSKTLLKSTLLPAFFSGLLAYVVASLFFYTYQMGIDTLLMCFIEEKKQVEDVLKGDRKVEYQGPPSLVNFMQGGKAFNKDQKAAAAKGEGGGEEKKEFLGGEGDAKGDAKGDMEGAP